ncbi:MAG: dephospho-CoA kinase [Saccharospirillum sp.]
MSGLVGLTGGIGSGKSAAQRFFEAMSIGCVDADVVAREVVQPGEPALAAIVEHFGPAVLDSQGALNRAVLRERIFSDADARAWLEGLLHPVIRERMMTQLAGLKGPYRLLVAPLLFENGLDALCDATVLVDAPAAVQIERVMARDGVSEAQAQAVLASQMAREAKLARAEYVLDNSGSLDGLKAQVLAMHQQFLKRFSAECS